MQPELTREKYIELKEAGASDLEISKLFGITKGAVLYRKRKWGLVEKKIEEKSLCWYCHKARPSLCDWIAQEKHVFKKHEIRRIRLGSPRTNNFEDVVIVTECDHYEPMKKLRGRKYVRKN